MLSHPRRGVCRAYPQWREAVGFARGTSDRFDLALNLKTPKDLNLTNPPTLLGLANTVIE
jgi:hypothetical protein